MAVNPQQEDNGLPRRRRQSRRGDLYRIERRKAKAERIAAMKEERARRRELREEKRKEKMQNRGQGIQLGGIFGKLFNKNKKSSDD
jgi:hypothetical protein